MALDAPASPDCACSAVRACWLSEEAHLRNWRLVARKLIILGRRWESRHVGGQQMIYDSSALSDLLIIGVQTRASGTFGSIAGT